MNAPEARSVSSRKRQIPHLSADGLTLVMEYNGSAYMGLLLFDDFAFSRKIHDLLKTSGSSYF